MDFHAIPKDEHGYGCVFIVIDRFGKCAFSLPCHRNVTTPRCAKLYYTYIWGIYGTLETTVADRGPQFISYFMDKLCKLTGVQQQLSTADHP